MKPWPNTHAVEVFPIFFLSLPKPLMTTSCSADSLPKTRVHWVEPKLVAQVGFTEWTTDGKLRHPRFLGLRDDKDAREVVREK